MRTRRSFTLAPVVALLAVAALAADADSPADATGQWRTIDDATGKPKGVVRIFERDGVLFGTIQQSLVENSTHNLCTDCTDDRKDQPLIGLEIIRGLHKDGDEWNGGTILDPDNGKVYRCRLEVLEGGQRLAVRGYIGFSFLGRSQTWERIE